MFRLIIYIYFNVIMYPSYFCYVKTKVVALGSTDKGHKGQWELMTSGANMTFFAWRDQEPTMKQGEDCLFLTGSPRMAMDDGACEGPSFIRVLCEMGE